MPKILVVDDDRTQRTIISEILKKDGHEVTACAGAAEAIEALSFFPFDLVVTDILMPEHDGFEVIQAVRNLRPAARIIVVSGIDDQVPRDLTEPAFDRLGVVRVIRKPVQPAELLNTVLLSMIAE